MCGHIWTAETYISHLLLTLQAIFPVFHYVPCPNSQVSAKLSKLPKILHLYALILTLQVKPYGHSSGTLPIHINRKLHGRPTCISYSLFTYKPPFIYAYCYSLFRHNYPLFRSNPTIYYSLFRSFPLITHSSDH